MSYLPPAIALAALATVTTVVNALVGVGAASRRRNGPRRRRARRRRNGSH